MPRTGRWTGWREVIMASFSSAWRPLAPDPNGAVPGAAPPPSLALTPGGAPGVRRSPEELLVNEVGSEVFADDGRDLGEGEFGPVVQGGDRDVVSRGIAVAP